MFILHRVADLDCGPQICTFVGLVEMIRLSELPHIVDRSAKAADFAAGEVTQGALTRPAAPPSAPPRTRRCISTQSMAATDSAPASSVASGSYGAFGYRNAEA